ncbi:hypothetical protein HDU91_001078, partial [Kappamyces sp. JEL0680]
MTQAIQTLIELGIPSENYARELLDKYVTIERAVEAFFSQQNNLSSCQPPLPTSGSAGSTSTGGFWSRLGSNLSLGEAQGDTQLLEGISASLREFRGIPENVNSEPVLELDTQAGDPEERLRKPHRPVGLVGLKNTTAFTCIAQAAFHWKPLYDILIDASHNIVDWGSHVENFDINSTVPMQDLLLELTKVFAGLQLSKRTY